MNSLLVRHLAAVRSALVLTIALGLLSTAALVAQMLMISLIVSRAFLNRADLPGLWPLLLLLLGASLLRAALVGGREFMARRSAIRVKSALRAQLFAHLLALGPAHTGGEATGELVTTAVEGIERLDAYVSRYLPQVVLSVLVPLLIAAAVMPFDVTSPVLLLGAAPLIPLLMVVVRTYAQQHIQTQWTPLHSIGAGVLEPPPPGYTPTAASSAGTVVAQPIGPLTVPLRDVTYAYPTRKRPALDGVTCTLRPGTRTALVGRSGAGKSTLVDLLLRFRDAQTGIIAVNNQPLVKLPPEQWRAQVALVPQRPYLFAGSLRENLLLARPAAGDAQLLDACARAGLAGVAAALPDGLDTQLGERGTGLSAGQAQRLAIARAFLKDAPLLILDEPTSSLDPASEALIRLAPGR